MQIESDELERLSRQQEIQRQLIGAPQTGGVRKPNVLDFDNILATVIGGEKNASKEVSNKDMTKVGGLTPEASVDAAALSAMNMATINAMLTGKLDGTQGQEGLDDFENEMNTIASMIENLDTYAQKLTEGNSDKAAWENLETITGQMASMQKKNLPTGLTDILSEIQVLASAEKFKMNRGDYNF